MPTVTVNVHEAAAPLAVHVTVVVALGKRVPEAGGVQVTVVPGARAPRGSAPGRSRLRPPEMSPPPSG